MWCAWPNDLGSVKCEVIRACEWLETINHHLFTFICLYPFYRQILQYWHELYSIPPSNAIEVQKEYIWYNKFITVVGKPLISKPLYDAGIMTINDLIDN